MSQLVVEDQLLSMKGTSPGDICTQIMQNIDQAPNYRRSIQAYGTFEDKAFNINAPSKAEVLTQCASACWCG